MKITIPKPTEIEATHILANIPVRYGTDDIPNDFPLRYKDNWEATILIDSGEIIDYPKQNESKSLSMKVCDEGCYYLMNLDTTIASRIQEYVPTCIPGEYGDYVEFDVSPDGIIKNWKRFCTKDRVIESFFPKE